MKNIPCIALILALSSLFIISCASSGNSVQNAATRAAIDSNRWTFTVSQVQPQIGRTQVPNGNYSVICAPNNLNVYLPYFGRAFSGADVYNTSQSPLHFISKEFTLEKVEVKTGKWTVIIVPTDQRQVQRMTYTFYNNSSASLDVILTNRSPIRFTGTVGRN